MRRNRLLVAEFLEQRTLLSTLAYSLSTNQSAYEVGQPIQMTFTETNTGSQPLTVQVDPTDFTVSQNGCAIWQSNPGSGSQTPATETLQPGQSLSQTATWASTTPYSLGLPPGTMTWQLNHFGTFSVSNPNAPQGLNASFSIANPVTYSLTTDKQVYQLGEPVQATFTEVNTAPISITIPSSPPEAFAVYQNGTPLWPVAYPQVLTLNPITLNAGQTITGTQTFNIVPDSGPYGLDKLTGAFDATYGPQNDPTQYAAPFQVAAPSPDGLVTGITTDRSSYTDGQSVNMTFTETNNGTQPIAVLTGMKDFQITQGGKVIWSSTPPATLLINQPGWTTLQPGQTYSQTDTWNASNISAITAQQVPGTFVVTDLLDPNGSSATFQIITTVFVPPVSPIPPVSVPPTIPPIVSPSPVTAILVPGRSVYQPGQDVRLTMTLRNTSAIKVAVPANAGTDGITVMQGSTVVFRSTRIPVAASIIKPKGTIKLAIEWFVRANQPGAGKLNPGTYTVTVVKGGFAATATIRISGHG